MNDVREICERMLVTPPPLRDSAEVLAAARRSVVRRRRAGVASVGALTAAATGVVLTLQLTPAGGTALPAPLVVAPLATSSAAPAPARTPPAKAAFTHSAQMRHLLLGLAPAGYSVRDFPVSYDKDFDPTAVLPNRGLPAPRNGLMSVAFAGLLLGRGGGEGLLSANIWSTGDPKQLDVDCSAPARPAKAVCKMVTVDGVAIQVTTWNDERGRHVSASRALAGGALILSADQGLGTDESQTPLDGRRPGNRVKPRLATLPVTADQLAKLAANPDMLQFP
ncbi:hypothetical protein SAMN05421812_11577 [Asanoa hainanensis]|uniref:Uncharacterized protein n=1 Tax=Asanoa hainanensis TaxID=560556 RepID=A0A239P8V3_9ACTN|nr:hypothetical protein [Asanoa hainanensis]SNT63372.1 hypothetical protein SAMN05421812_11577 [Asanoa hainanensis]